MPIILWSIAIKLGVNEGKIAIAENFTGWSVCYMNNYKGTSITANAGIDVPFCFVLFAQKQMISIDYYVKNVSKGSKHIIEMV